MTIAIIPQSFESLPRKNEAVNADSTEQLARYCKALAHPARIQIVQLLSSVEACICGEIVDQFPLAQSTISQHLKVLKEAGLIQGEIDGPRTCYCLNRAAFQHFKSLIEQAL